MRILFLINNLRAGGAERVCALLANAWSNRGHRVTVMPTYIGDEYRNDFEFDPAVEFKPLALEVGLVCSGPITRLRRIRHEIASGGHDIVVSFMVNENIKAIAASVGTGVPVVISERSHPPSTPASLPLRTLRRITYPFASHLVMQTGEGMEWAQRQHICANVATIPNPLVYPLSGTRNPIAPGDIVSPGSKLLLAVGRLHGQKRFASVIKAFASSKAMRQGWMLVILGEGEERMNLEGLIASLGMEETVRLPGRAGNMHDWYTAADGFVLASSYEGYPNALLEALAYGVPAVATDCATGPRELAEGNRNAILVADTDDPDVIAGALERLVSLRKDPQGDHATRLRQQHSLDVIADQWLSLLADCARETILS